MYVHTDAYILVNNTNVSSILCEYSVIAPKFSYSIIGFAETINKFQNYGCDYVYPTKNAIAIIRQQNCTFFDQIYNTQKAGYKGIILSDYYAYYYICTKCNPIIKFVY